MKIFVSERAAGDLLHIYQYVSERNPAAAERSAREIHRKFENLARFPFIGRQRPSLGVGTRSIVAGVNVIFYTVEQDRVVIVRVMDGRRDIDAEFQR